MLQFYFLSVLLNAITGMILLFTDKDDPDFVSPIRMPAMSYDETFRLVVGILAAITGFFKLLTAIQGDVPVIGDLIPALAGLAGGFTLIYEFYRLRSSTEEENLPRFVRKIMSSKRYVGVACLIAAGLHFLFPNVLLL
jgi:hypothetical protein